ncbi:bifunctional ADP-dependent NAD(P)H-hydrate dehydratase/NAD(P)H-hydrate epimerase [Pantoea sp. Aalb]|uniref:bifunctional ADP-dependent NAD(P)H-hydrate dehydratase/NAD(P)H-hydrate epimerase n=1 Tax=Pantoea sp. Aalb TaxID=2576762 RepID=UPI00132C8EC9|nr:bifunctional ADP-dependent NAD(P)H-hydrate dehydratase/NAD(P)H-hydrate epimerase [Pantoea sp. Aalb]MXP67672.1 bifunctional ADP-dependent NAD(P)H-hydrate dehydratase/NAD(P)H-hydrate epimerase [Pantoea sp. Aalb]
MITKKKRIYKNILPHTVWPIQLINKLEYEAINTLDITLYELMQRAGKASYKLALEIWPLSQHWMILCGHGNNGGDGYVIARLAYLSGINVTLLAHEHYILSKEAQQSRDAWLSVGGVIYPTDITWPKNVDLIVDALFGIGINREIIEPYNNLIEMMNSHVAPVLSIDIPSGLSANNGITLGSATVVANHTISMIGLKPGQLIGEARDYVGCLHYDDLGLSSFLFSKNQEAPIIRYDVKDLNSWFKQSKKSLHKYNNGCLLVIGGDIGTGGAIKMTAEAALRSGAGLVRVLTHKDNICSFISTRPELMVDVLNEELLQKSLEWANVIVIGPGLGQRDWGRNALKIISISKKPMLWDADALNLLAMNQDHRNNRIITPHLGEAARLLGMKISEVKSNLLQIAPLLAQRYGGVVVLKGAGTIIADYTGKIAIADVGNVGMASGGMGDVLSGIIAALLCQKLTLIDAACAGCVAHGAAGDTIAAQRGTRGMLATDLFEVLWQFVNPEIM